MNCGILPCVFVCVVRTCENGNETSGFIKGGKYLDQLSDY